MDWIGAFLGILVVTVCTFAGLRSIDRTRRRLMTLPLRKLSEARGTGFRVRVKVIRGLTSLHALVSQRHSVAWQVRIDRDVSEGSEILLTASDSCPFFATDESGERVISLTEGFDLEHSFGHVWSLSASSELAAVSNEIGRDVRNMTLSAYERRIEPGMTVEIAGSFEEVDGVLLIEAARLIVPSKQTPRG